jgi:hypothetical protein
MCCKAKEYIKHSVVGSTALAPSGYINRHNKVAVYIHRTVCKHVGLQVTDRYCGHVPESVLFCGMCQLSQIEQY